MNVRNSLTVILPVLDADACRVELERQRPALEHGWAKVPGLSSACLALLPAAAGPERAVPALFLECSFETEFADLMFVWFMACGDELSAVLSHCAEYPESADARRFAEYLGSRARRSSTLGSRSALNGEFALGRTGWRVLDAVSLRGAAPDALPSEDEREARRLGVGMQEPIPGVPLVHVAWLAPGRRPQLLRALRELEHQPSAVEYDPRFLLDGRRLVFVAYPNEGAARWSERLSQVALAACTRVWRNCRGFSGGFGVQRARRARRVQEFVLEHRIPVAAWFNARVPFRGDEREN
ncbi:MAG: hypothetical protein ABIQ16_17380 [Polyangiaceae bacterium]